MTPRTESFRVDGGDLVREVTPRSGRAYEHRCARAVFVEAVHAVDDLEGAPFVYETLREATGAPASQVAAAFAFLRERSCIVPAGRKRSRAATSDVFLDAMTELEALAEGRV